MSADRFALALLGAMMALPFLVPLHAPPISTFYPEWLAVALGIAAAAALLRGPLRWPRIAALPLLLVAVLLAQVLGGRLPYAESGLLAMLYLLWAALVMVAATTLRARLGLERVAEHLAFWVLAGALADAAVGLLAAAGVRSAWIMPLMPGQMQLYGNLAQVNQFAHHLWLGLASALYLAARGRLALAPATAACGLLLVAVGLTGSRACLLYAIWLLVVSLRWEGLGPWRRALAVAAAYLAAAALLPLLRDWGEAATPAARLVADIRSAGGIRPKLFLVGWEMFLQAPWLGLGFGSFARASFLLAERWPDWHGAGEHAHNLLAQLLGEFGLFAAVGTCLMLWRPASALVRDRATPAHAWLAAIAGIALIHSLVEYPLWHAFFLGAFSAALALADGEGKTLRFARAALAAPVALGALVAFLLLRDYAGVQALAEPTTMASTDADFVRARNRALLEVRKGSLLKPHIDLAVVTAAAPTRGELDAKKTLCRLTLEFQPTSPGVFTCALVLHLAGDAEAAARLWRLAHRVFPEDAAGYVANVEAALGEEELRELRPLLSQSAALRSP